MSPPVVPGGWRGAAKRLLARLRPGRPTGIGASEAAEFDLAARQAYQAALRLEMGSPITAARSLRPG